MTPHEAWSLDDIEPTVHGVIVLCKWKNPRVTCSLRIRVIWLRCAVTPGSWFCPLFLIITPADFWVHCSKLQNSFLWNGTKLMSGPSRVTCYTFMKSPHTVFIVWWIYSCFGSHWQMILLYLCMQILCIEPKCIVIVMLVSMWGHSGQAVLCKPFCWMPSGQSWSRVSCDMMPEVERCTEGGQWQQTSALWESCNQGIMWQKEWTRSIVFQCLLCTWSLYTSGVQCVLATMAKP